MRSHILGITLVALLMPRVSSAQAPLYFEPTPKPAVTAARAAWQIGGDAIYYMGDFYYPTGPTEFFDGNVMRRTGTHDGVPLYENSVLLPFDIVYVPVGGGRMKPYERRRDRMRAGTTGSRTPSFPVHPRFLGGAGGDDPVRATMTARLSVGRAQWEWPTPVEPVASPALTGVPGRGASIAPQGVVREVPRRETTNAGAFVAFEGQRYYSAGRATVPTAGRFTRAGEQRGAAVFRDASGDAKTIYVESVPGGPLAPYRRR